MAAKLKTFLKTEPVLAAAALGALFTALAVPPDAAWLDYFDLRVLCLLYCLMVVVAGFQECNLFACLAQKLLSGQKDFRRLALALVLLPFFSAMVITNDVALLTFVPFTVLILSMIKRPQYLIYYVVLQTVAANLGSSLLPIGNPQNLFLYSFFHLSFPVFLKTMLPLFLLSLLLLSLAALAGGRGVSIELRFPQTVAIKNRPLFGLLAVLFVLCLLSVFRLLPYGLLLLLFLTLLGPARPQLLKKADFGLLATFVCFFIFAGNLGRLPQIRQFLESLLSGDVLLTSLAASQFISNVPAAVLLSGFTQDWQGLLLGTNIGGLGTPVASLASLISFKLYLKSEKASPRRYLLLFSLANLLGLSLLLLFVRLIGQW